MRSDKGTSAAQLHFQQEFVNFLRNTAALATYSTACALLAQTTTTLFGSRRAADAVAICIGLLTVAGAWFAVDLLCSACIRRFSLGPSRYVLRLALLFLVIVLIAAPWVVVRQQVSHAQ
jgi:hypothetical protein